jgi:hypothetical protein
MKFVVTRHGRRNEDLFRIVMPRTDYTSHTMSDSNLVYICDWLPPDFGAVGQYSVLFARQMAESGMNVVLIGLTSSQADISLERFSQGTVQTVKVSVPPYSKADTRARIVWTIRTNTKLLLAAWPFIRKSQAVLFTGSPPLFIHWIAPINVLLGKRLIYRITDFHPECAIAERGAPSLFLKIVLALTLFWRRRIHRFEVLGHDQTSRLRDIGIPEDRIFLKRDPSPVDIRPTTDPLPRPPGTEGKFLLLYSGNWGVAHDHATFLEAYVEHYRRGSGTVLLWLNAVGKGAKTVADALEAAQVPFVRSELVPLDQLAALIRTPDAHLITLKDAFVGYVLPSKIYACINSDLPVLFIGSTGSDVHFLCRERASSSYFHVDVGDVDKCVRLLEHLGKRYDPYSALPMKLVRSDG